jgi:teichuronic acid biosynthesis glycosyltransferase TuaH
VVFFAGTAWDGNKFPDQHIAERLTKWAPVLYVDPPVAVVGRGDGRRLRSPTGATKPVRIGERLFRLSPVVLPGKNRALLRSVTVGMVRAMAARAARLIDLPVSLAVAATLLPVFGACGERKGVLYATDDFAAGAALMGLSEDWVRELEDKAVKEADLVIVVSEYLADSLEKRKGISSLVIENGVDVELFATADFAQVPDDVVLPPPIAGFVGHLSDRIDLQMLEASAETGRSLLLVGPRQGTFEIKRMERLLALSNVQWVGPKAFESLPSYLRVMKVGLLPYADSEFNRASFPLKVLEYLAAGRRTVVSDLPAVRTLGKAVRVASTPEEFASAVVEELDAPPDKQAADLRRRTAAARSWDTAAAEFARAIGLTNPPR